MKLAPLSMRALSPSSLLRLYMFIVVAAAAAAVAVVFFDDVHPAYRKQVAAHEHLAEATALSSGNKKLGHGWSPFWRHRTTGIAA